MADFGFVDEVLPYGRIRWHRANLDPRGVHGWTGGYETGEATAIPASGVTPGPEVGQVVPLYRHAKEVFYGLAVGP